MIFFNSNANSDYKKIFFDFNITNINDEKLELSTFKNKTVLLVNVASNCGFTKQYTDLQNLYEKYKDKGLVVIGVPSNQFGVQEPVSNNDIKKFCETNFNITFTITNKYNAKGDDAHPIYLWAKDNYGNSALPKWTFHKLLLNTDGKIQHTFASFTNPTSNKIIHAIEKILSIPNSTITYSPYLFCSYFFYILIISILM